MTFIRKNTHKKQNKKQYCVSDIFQQISVFFCSVFLCSFMANMMAMNITVPMIHSLLIYLFSNYYLNKMRARYDYIRTAIV